MKYRNRHIFKSAVLALACIAAVRVLTPQQSCSEYTGAFSELLLNTSNMDLTQCAAKFWYNDPANPRDIVSMSKQGANFAINAPTYVPGWVNSVASGDFDLDGWPDYVASSSSYSNVLAFVRNMGGQGQIGTFTIGQWIDGSTGDATGWPTRGVGGAALDTSGHCGMTSGDYDGDGDLDFLFIASPDASPYTPKRIWLYRNNIITNGVQGALSFTQVDLTSAWSATVKGIAWSSTMLVTADLDADGDADIVMGNSEGNVLKITNTGNDAVNASTFHIEPAAIITTGWGLRGVSTVAVGDYDGDNALDIIVGSVSYDSLLYYANDGQGVFTLAKAYTDPAKDPNNDLFDGAATVTLAADFDTDGYTDLIVGTDNWNYGTNYGGKCYFFRNKGGDFYQKLIFNGQTRSPQAIDFDLGCIFDFNRDGLLDFMIADGNDTHNYYVFINQTANVYNTSGTAVSANLTPTLSPSQYAITQVQITRIDQGFLGNSSSGLSVAYYISNNNGRSWELCEAFSEAGIVNVTNRPVHNFNSFGTALRWKAVFDAAEDTIPGFTNASSETPFVDRIGLSYTYVDRREYSRTSTTTTLIVGGETRKILIGATFLFPGYQGELRAYDTTDLSPIAVSYSAIQTVSRANPTTPGGRELTSGVTIFWDAGELLAARSPDSRTIYCGYRASAGAALQRKDFTTANTSTLATLLSDVNGDNAGLINFIRGEDRDWKLGDIQHSNPIILGPPDGNETLMGAGYAAFASGLANRSKVLFVGANDGMLHCFDVATGTELWGFIPYNLLPKLKKLSARDTLTKRRYSTWDTFVDGSPVVADVQIGGAWRTILISGQGPGKGSSVGSGLNYYFALDVTDPQNPVPLWEITAATMGETWSAPAIGRSRVAASPWVAFMGSGYDNDPAAVVGNRFYAINAATGAFLKTFSVTNVDTSRKQHPNPYTDIYVAIPGSPTELDANDDGFVDFVYVGDLDGRLWKLNASNSNVSNWSLNAIYTDALNYPIITRPAVFLNTLSAGEPPRIYFGTGGDDRARADRNYSFIALKDLAQPDVEWYLGKPTDLGLPSSEAVGAFGVGEKVWADPVMSDNIIYFTTLKGSIENVNPCVNLAEGGNLYARFVQTQAGGVMGKSALTVGTATRENIQLISKSRRAVTLGERSAAGGTNKREVYIHEYDSTIERLEQGTGSFLKIKSWREVYKIIR